MPLGDIGGRLTRGCGYAMGNTLLVAVCIERGLQFLRLLLRHLQAVRDAPYGAVFPDTVGLHGYGLGAIHSGKPRSTETGTIEAQAMIAAIARTYPDRAVVCPCSCESYIALANPLHTLPVAVAVVRADLDAAVVTAELDRARLTGRAITLARDRVARAVPTAIIRACPRGTVGSTKAFVALAPSIAAETVARAVVLERV